MKIVCKCGSEEVKYEGVIRADASATIVSVGGETITVPPYTVSTTFVCRKCGKTFVGENKEKQK